MSATGSAVDLDEVLDTLTPATRSALQEIIEGSAAQYAGAARQIDESIPYVSPTLAAADHILAQLDHDQPAFTQFVAATANTVTRSPPARPQLGALVGNADQTFGVVGAQSAALTAGCASCRTRCVRATARSPISTRPSPRSPSSSTRPARHDDARPPPARAHPAARAGQRPGAEPQPGHLAAGTGQRSHRACPGPPGAQRGRRCARPPTPPRRCTQADADRGRSSRRTHPTSSARCAAPSAESPPTTTPTATTRASHRVFADFAPSSGGTLSPVNPLTGLAALQTGQTRRCPGRGRGVAAGRIRPVRRRRRRRVRDVRGAGRMRRRSARSLAGSPLLIGAVTTLVVIVAVYLAYNANNGLPFVPTYDVKVALPDANSLRVGDEVRIGGTRVGVVAAEAAAPGPADRRRERGRDADLQKRLGHCRRTRPSSSRDRSALGREVPPAHPGDVGAARSRRARRSRCRPRRRSRSRSTSCWTCSTRRRARRARPTSPPTATPSPGAGPEPQRRDLRASPTLANLAAASPARSPPRGRDSPPCSSRSTARRPTSPRWPGSRPGSSPISTRRSRRSPASLRRFGRATIQGARARCARPPRRSPTRGRSCGSSRASSPCSFRATGRAAQRRPDARPGRSTAGATNLPARDALNRQLKPTLARCAPSRSTRASRSGWPTSRATADAAEPLVADLAGMQTTCNYPTLLLRNLSSALAEGSSNGTWLPRPADLPVHDLRPAAADACRPTRPRLRPPRRTAKSAPASRAGERRRRRRAHRPALSASSPTTCTTTRIRTSPAPGQPAGRARPATRDYATGQDGHRSTPRSVASGRDFITSRRVTATPPHRPHGRRRAAPARISPLRAGVIVGALIALRTYAGVHQARARSSHGFRFDAVFSSALNIGIGAPVRIAGVRRRQGDAACRATGVRRRGARDDRASTTTRCRSTPTRR